MKKILLFSKDSLYRENMKVYGYLFGTDTLEEGKKTIAVVSGMRGNEFTQIYEASQLVKRLKILEEQGRVRRDKGILWLDMTGDPVAQACAAIDSFIGK